MTLTRRQLLALAAGSPLLKAAPSALFEEMPSSLTGITWTHQNAMSQERYLPETMGPGCAFLDFDNDGWMDVYLVNSGPSDFWTPKTPLRNALYRNNRDGTFTDVTEKAGVAGGTFGMGAVWFDYDNDGRLDLFICSFVDYGTKEHFSCGDNKLGLKYYCIPRVFKGTASFLYHNNGDGTFTQVQQDTAIAKAMGKGLGVVATDVNNDGRMDLFVANDTVQNFLFMNRGPDRHGKTQWEEVALQAEVGFSENGQPRSGMGVDSADLNGDGWQDLFVANVDQEKFSVYRNNKNETFTDVAHLHGVSESTRLLSGWGLKYFDYDNDGDVDLILANGHPDDMIEKYSAQVRYKEPLVLFHQERGKLRNVTAEAGAAFTRSYPARGLAVGDFNNDGRLDVLIGNNGGSPVLLKNCAGSKNNWVGLRLQGVKCNRDAIGARLKWSAGGVTRSRLKTSGGSYLSSHDVREVLGVGEQTQVDWVEIHWPKPSTTVTRLAKPAMNTYITVTESR